MRIQKMVAQANMIARGKEEKRKDLRETVSRFEETLATIQQNKAGLGILSPPHDVEDRLQEIGTLWKEFRLKLDTLAREPTSSEAFQNALTGLNGRGSQLLDEADQTVSLFEAAYEAQVNRVKGFLAVSIVGILGVMGLFLFFAERNVTRPLERLRREAEAIAAGDTSKEVTEITAQDEIGSLTRSVREMKRKLVRSLKKVEIFRTIVEQAGHSIYWTGPDGTIEYVNPAFEQITGYGREVAVGKTPRLLQSGEHDDAFYKELWSTIQAGEVWEGEIVDESADGERIVTRQTIAPVKNGDGETEYFVAVGTDVTDQKEAERALQEERDRLETLFENLPTPVVRCTAQDDGAIISDVNRAFEDVFGVKASSARGKSIDDLLVPRSKREQAAELNYKAMAGETLHAEVQRKTASGLRDFQLQATGREAQDGPPEIYAIYTDITEQKEREETLRKEQTVLRSMYRISASRDAPLEEKVHRLLDLGRDYLGVSSGALIQVQDGRNHVLQSSGGVQSPEAAAPHPLSEICCRRTVRDGELEAVQEATSGHLAPDEKVEEPERPSTASYMGAPIEIGGDHFGTFCFASEEAREEPFTQREKTFVELMARWTTYELEQRRATRRLERQNERLDRFASIVAHDLRNPLTVAKGRLGIAVEEGNLDHLEEVDGALDRMYEIIEGVLTLTWGGNEIDDERLEAVSLVEASEDSWEHVETDEATLQVEDEFAIVANEARLRHLFENLFRNALEHGGKEVTIRIGALSDGFYVEDDGPGIPEEKRDQVLEAGYTSGEEATGLGLSIVKTIAEAHGWVLTVEDGRDGGARFEVREVQREHAPGD